VSEHGANMARAGTAASAAGCSSQQGVDASSRQSPISDAEAIELLQTLVEIPSLSGEERAASEMLATWMSHHGMQAAVDESGSAVGIINGSAPADGVAYRDVVLLGHIDTVPGHIPVRIENCELWGRGSVDAKGSLATFAAAAVGLEIPAGTRLIVIGATEEEAASSRGAHHAAKCFKPRACVIGEPSSSGAVTIAYKGRLVVHITINTGSAHSAGPEATAAELAVEAWRVARSVAAELAPGAASAFDQVQAKLRSVSSRSDGLFDMADMHIGFRLPPGIDPFVLEQKFRDALAAEALLTAEGTTLELRATGHEYAHSGDPRSWLVACFNGAIRDRGLRPRLLRKTGTSDMNVVARSWDCPIVAYGPGDSSLDHTPVERLPIDEYIAAIATLRGALASILARVAAE
jgi:LysW-gamma-L-lysine carboxypeptidase